MPVEIREYVKATDLDSAYALLQKSKTNLILGGCTFLKRTRKRVGTAIDLKDCGLSYIRETDTQVEIGAYTSLRELETSPLILERFGNAFQQAVEHLIGVQLRDAITIGGHVYSRFGFSDIIPTLLALNARIRFYHEGEKSLWEYLQQEKRSRDILVEIILPKEGRRSVVQMMRSSYNDYSIFCLAVSRSEAGNWIVAGGVFPGRAKLALETMEEMNRSAVTRDQAQKLAQKIADGFTFGDNYRGSGAYRKQLCRVFARRAIEELANED